MTLSTRSALATDAIDLTAAPCKLTDAAELNGLNVTYEADLGTGSSTATDLLDGIALDLQYQAAAPYPPTTATSTAPGPSTTTFANPDNAKVIGEQPTPLTASAMLTPAATSASIDLSGFDSVPLTPGSAIDKVTLRVAHQDDDTTNPAPAPPATAAPPTPSWTLSGPNYSGPCSTAQTHGLATHQGQLGTDSVGDLTTWCQLNDPAQLTGLKVTYSATIGTGSTSATDQLDGVEVDIVFRAPAIEALSGCVTAGPYPGTGCALITTVADSGQTRLVVQGTVYTPTAALDVSMSQVSAQLLTRGLIARTIDLGLSPAPGYTRPLVGVPPEPVLFTAFPAIDVTPTGPPTAATGFTAATQTNALKIDGATADADLDSSNSSASLTLSGYQSPALPSGPISHSILRVDHFDDSAVGAVSVSVAFPGSTCAPIAVPLHPSLAEDQIDLSSMCGLDATSQLAGLAVTYSAMLGTLPPGQMSAPEHLDGMELVVVDTVNGTRAPASVDMVSSFSSPSQALTIDTTSATATLDSSTTSASLRLKGYDQTAPLPSDRLEHAILRVVHQDDGDVGSVSVSVAFPGSTCAGTASAPALVLPLHSGMLVEDQLDLTAACGLTSAGQVAGLTVTYTASLGSGGVNGTDALDGTQLDLESGPSVRAAVSFTGSSAIVEQWTGAR